MDTQVREQVKRARNVFAGITIFTAVFSAIYEYFSHGVYSGFMVWAALIPLLGVVLPYTVWLRTRGSGKAANASGIAFSVYQSAVLTFLLGSVFTGILEIYGTTNRLSKVYWIVGGGLLVASLVLYVIKNLHSPFTMLQ